ncbi:glycosyltransferase family 4 protein [Kouleothrix sp.]|uniref:glycosyltransferase family 4 protein n=1 Tax=Kouleothrix sp. TaxID=2779161 RepID=UPI00391C7CB1
MACAPPAPTRSASRRCCRRCRASAIGCWGGWASTPAHSSAPTWWARYPRADVYHLTSQNLASLLLFRRPAGKVVVTVHDIIPYMLRADRQLSVYRGAADRLFDRMAMAGLKRADRLIAVSHYSKRSVVALLHIRADQIDVVHESVDHSRFRPLDVPAALRERYSLPAGRRYLIYVGSDDPRKNLATLLRALAELRQTQPDVELIKVGRAHFDAERARLRALAAELGLAGAIHWLDDVPERDLPLLYGLADLCVMPSLYEGFGFPVIEAMACGTPVVAANASSLPELLGDAGRLYEPRDVHALAEAIGELLGPGARREQLRQRAAARSAISCPQQRSRRRWRATRCFRLHRYYALYRVRLFRAPRGKTAHRRSISTMLPQAQSPAFA